MKQMLIDSLWPFHQFAMSRKTDCSFLYGKKRNQKTKRTARFATIRNTSVITEILTGTGYRFFMEETVASISLLETIPRIRETPSARDAVIRAR